MDGGWPRRQSKDIIIIIMNNNLGLKTNFRKDVKSLIAVTEELGNPFEVESENHYAWH